MSQLQNSSLRKIALLGPLATAATRLLSQVYSHRGSPCRLTDTGKGPSKSSIFRRRGILQLALKQLLFFFLLLSSLSAEGIEGYWKSLNDDTGKTECVIVVYKYG